MPHFTKEMLMFKQVVAVSLIAATLITITGCNSAGGPAMPQSRAGQGAVMGGLGGAAVGAALGPKKALQNAAIGGAVGALGGGLIGQQMDKQEQRAYEAGYYDAQTPPPPPRRY